MKPFDSIEEEVFLNLQRTAESLMGGLSEVLKAFDLTATQYNVLRILRGAGPAGLPAGSGWGCGPLPAPRSPRRAPPGVGVLPH